VQLQIFSKWQFIKSFTFAACILKVYAAAFAPPLHFIQLFPPALFKRYRKYGVAVFMCEHHGVKEYIELVVKSCREWLSKVKDNRKF
jgi:hypothetical protein